MPTFSDIPEDHPYYDAIEWAAANGITIGYPDGTYRSDRALSRGEMAVFLQRYDGSAPVDPEPEPEPDPDPTGVLWSHDFEDGTTADLRFTSSAGTLHDAVPDPTGRSGWVMRMTGDVSDGSSSGNRARVDGQLDRPDDINLPTDATYEAWFYLVDNQTKNNIFQWKQSWLLNLSDPSIGITRELLWWFRITHVGNGAHDLVLRSSIDLTTGSWEGPHTSHARLDGSVHTGQWHHLKARYKWDETDGIIQAWLDGAQFADLQAVRTQGRTVQDATLGDPLPGQPTYHDWLRQWTVNNYMNAAGAWVPPATTILWDDLKVTK